MSARHFALLLAATMPAACTNPPPPPAETDGNQSGQIGSMGAPGAPVAPNQELPATAPAENATSPAQAAKVEADYVGKWIGPEGLVLEVKPKPGGGVTIANQWTLDDNGNFDGSVNAEGLRFMRNGETVTASPSNGDATGMKWLAGKRDCLTVKSGEGYCRD